MMVVDKIESKLSGSLGERHRTLNELVKNSKGELSSEDLQDLTSKKQIDLIYIARLANYTKNGFVVCQLFKSQDGMVVSVAMQSKWFFQGLSHPEYVNIDYFAKEIFPYTSFHTLCRIVSNFSAYIQVEEIAEDFYTYIYEKHGRKLAIKLLPKCRVEFIRTQIIENLLEVPCTQMYSIYMKNPDLALEYLEMYAKKEKAERMPVGYNWNNNQYKKVLKKVAEEDPKRFIDFMIKHPSYITYGIGIGRKNTKAILKVCGDKIFDKSFTFNYLLDQKTLTRSLKGEKLEKYILDRFPDLPMEFSSYDQVILRLKPEFRLKLLMKLFPLKYNGASFLESPRFMEFNLLEYLPVDVRVKLLNKKLENISGSEMSEEHYLKYLPTQDGLPRLQSLLRTADDWIKRSQFLNHMVECCKFNNDTVALLDVLKHVSERYRNDLASLRQSFLRNVRASFELQELSPQHWKFINEIIDFLCIEKEIEKNYWYYFIVEYTHEYINYCIKNKIDYEPYVDKIIFYEKNGQSKSLENTECDPKVFEMFIEKYKQILMSKGNSTAQDHIEKHFQIVLYLIRSINYQKKGKSIVDYPWILDIIKENYTKWSDSNKIVLFKEIEKDKEANKIFMNEIYKYLFNEKLALKYIKYKPEVVMNQIDHFIKNTMITFSKKYIRIYGKIHVYLTDPLGKQIVKVLEKRILKNQEAETTEQLGIDIIFLSYLSPSEKSKKLLEEYAPSDHKVDLETNKKEYVIGEIFGKYIGTLNPPVEFQILMRYTGGDYFKYSLSSLLMLAHKRPMSETRTLIYELTNKPVSIKKHSIRLAHSLCNKEELLPLYKRLWEVETNSSIRNIVFAFTYKLLIKEDNKEKCQEIWATLKYFITTFKETDQNLFGYLCKPNDYMPLILGEYCETSWKQLKKLASNKVDVKKYIFNLIRSFYNCMDLLSQELCEIIVAEYLNSLDDANSKYNCYELRMFVVNYLVNAKEYDSQDKRTEVVTQSLKKCIVEKWKIGNESKCGIKKIVEGLVSEICKKSLQPSLALNPIKLLKSFSEMLQSSLPKNIIRLNLIIHLTIIIKELLMEPEFEEKITIELVKRFGHKVALYLNELVVEYGTDIQRLLKRVFDDFQQLVTELNNLYFIMGLIEANINRECLLVAIDILPDTLPHNKEEQKIYSQIIDQITSQGDEIIKIILYSKIG